MHHRLDNFIGRAAVFIENDAACIGTVENVVSDGECVRVIFKLVPDSFRCRLRFCRHPGDDPIEERSAEPPFGDTWEVMVSNKEFYLEADYWQASFLWGGGFRVFFQPAFIQRFVAGDVTWLDEYYADGEEDDAGDSDGDN